MMRKPRRWPLIVALALSLGGATGCGSGNGMSPSNVTISNFATMLTASDGSVATPHPTGAPPAPNGGPSVTATSSGNVTDGGTDVVRLRATVPFQTVYVDVQGADGFFQVALKIATTDITLLINLGTSIPRSTYTAEYRVASTTGLVGTPTTVPNAVQMITAPTVNVTGTWAYQGQPVFNFVQNGSTVTGTEIFPSIQNLTLSSLVTGSVSGNTFSATNRWLISTTSGEIITCNETDGLSMQVTGTTMTGTYTSGTISCNQQFSNIPQQPPLSITLTKQ